MLTGATDPPERIASCLPRLGWRPTIVRLELARPMELSEAAYWLASFSRRYSTGVVAKLPGDRDLYVWPHQAVEDACRCHLRIGALLAECPGGRWTAERKQRVVDASQQGWVDKATAQAVFAISDEEFRLWEIAAARRAPAGRVA